MEAIRAVLDLAKGALTKCRAAGTQEEVFQGLLTTVESTLAAIEVTAQHAVQNQTTTGKKHMVLAESRSIQNLKTLGSDKNVYKTWNDKLINAMSSVMGVAWRRYLFALNARLDQKNKILTVEELKEVDGYAALDDIERANENLYYVLMEKTEGEAAIRVSSGIAGEGLDAYMRICLLYTSPSPRDATLSRMPSSA